MSAEGEGSRPREGNVESSTRKGKWTYCEKRKKSVNVELQDHKIREGNSGVEGYKGKRSGSKRCRQEQGINDRILQRRDWRREERTNYRSRAIERPNNTRDRTRGSIQRKVSRTLCLRSGSETREIAPLGKKSR